MSADISEEDGRQLLKFFQLKLETYKHYVGVMRATIK